jgi:hypothetical protein
MEGATAHLEVEALPAGMRAAVIAKRDRYERAIRSLVADHPELLGIATLGNQFDDRADPGLRQPATFE